MPNCLLCFKIVNFYSDKIKIICLAVNAFHKVIFIYDLLMLLNGINGKESNVRVEWYYLEEDIDMKEMGEDFKEALTIDFSFFEVETVE